MFSFANLLTLLPPYDTKFMNDLVGKIYKNNFSRSEDMLQNDSRMQNLKKKTFKLWRKNDKKSIPK